MASEMQVVFFSVSMYLSLKFVSELSDISL